MSKSGCKLVADECKLRVSREHKIGNNINGDFYSVYLLITSDGDILSFTNHGLPEKKSGVDLRYRLFEDETSLYAGVEEMLLGAKGRGVTKFKLIYGGENLGNVTESTSVHIDEEPRYREKHRIGGSVRANLDAILLDIYARHTSSTKH